MLVMRMLAGRMCEGWKVLSGFSKKLKADYEPHMSEDGRVALRNLRAYFNPGKGKQSSYLTYETTLHFIAYEKS